MRGHKKTMVVAIMKTPRPTIATPIIAGIHPRFFAGDRGGFDLIGDSSDGTNTPCELKCGMVTFFLQLTHGPD